MPLKTKEVVVSGMRPTGLLHLGHYFGVLKNWVELQNQYSCYFFVADWHSLTTEYQNVAGVQKAQFEMVVDWLASGVSPEKCIPFIQSHVPEHAELYLLLGMITPLGWLERVPSFKELQKELQGRELSTHGFLGYPLLQTSDVALYKAALVPVGEDQVAHIELAREVIRRFNFLYKMNFPEPKSLLTKAAKILGTDGRKMSKSYQNCIYLSESEEEMNAKIKGHYTDPARQRKTDPGNPDICPIYDYHKLVTDSQTNGQINQDCRKAAIGCSDCKKILMKSLAQELKPFREKRQGLQSNPKKVKEILSSGSEKARKVAGETLAEVSKAMGLG